MNKRAKAKFKDFIILIVVFVAISTFFISGMAILEKMTSWFIPFLTSIGVLIWFIKANE